MGVGRGWVGTDLGKTDLGAKRKRWTAESFMGLALRWMASLG